MHKKTGANPAPEWAIGKDGTTAAANEAGRTVQTQRH